MIDNQELYDNLVDMYPDKTPEEIEELIQDLAEMDYDKDGSEYYELEETPFDSLEEQD